MSLKLASTSELIEELLGRFESGVFCASKKPLIDCPNSIDMHVLKGSPAESLVLLEMLKLKVTLGMLQEFDEYDEPPQDF